MRVIKDFLLLLVIFVFTVGHRTIYVSANETTQITPPPYRYRSQNDTDITWNIHTDEDRKILISFSSFDTRYKRDYLRAGDGNDSTDYTDTFFIWSGTEEAADLLSSGNSMWLRFTTGAISYSYSFSALAQSVSSNGKLAAVTVSHRSCHWVVSDLRAADFDLKNVCNPQGNFGSFSISQKLLL